MTTATIATSPVEIREDSLRDAAAVLMVINRNGSPCAASLVSYIRRTIERHVEDCISTGRRPWDLATGGWQASFWPHTSRDGAYGCIVSINAYTCRRFLQELRGTLSPFVSGPKLPGER